MTIWSPYYVLWFCVRLKTFFKKLFLSSNLIQHKDSSWSLEVLQNQPYYYLFLWPQEIQITLEWNSVVPFESFGHYLLRKYKLILLLIQEKYGKPEEPNHIDFILKTDLKYLNCLYYHCPLFA